MRNKLLILLIFSLFTGNVLAQNEHVNSKKYTILLSGASFASPENGWFELGCRELDAKAINREIGDEAESIKGFKNSNTMACMCEKRFGTWCNCGFDYMGDAIGYAQICC